MIVRALTTLVMAVALMVGCGDSQESRPASGSAEPEPTAPEATPLDPAAPDDAASAPELAILGVEQAPSRVTVEAELHNTTGKPLWVCHTADSARGILCATTVDEDRGVWLWELHTVRVPRDILLEAPYRGRYERVEPGERWTRSVRAMAPPANRPAYGRENATQPAEPGEVSAIELQVGLFGPELMDLPAGYVRQTGGANAVEVTHLVLEKLDETILTATARLEPPIAYPAGGESE